MKRNGYTHVMITRKESSAREESIVGLKYLYRSGQSAASPLVVFVHGRAGNRGVMWTFERSIPQDCHIVSFEAFMPDPIGGWSWWTINPAVSDSKRADIVYAAHKLKHAVESFVRLYELAPHRMVALGFSQGGILVSAATFLELVPFDALGILASSVFLPSHALDARRTPRVFVAHGTQDETIPVEKARAGVEALRSRGVEVEYIEESVGHKLGIQGARALKGWIEGALTA